ncbi:CgeB family protein [Phocaeicola coprophilus]|uniref:CgeB family protein n=1 Tax=Phocaeicola coprophilus TaxID=387090 RepID=UPI0039F4740B
MKILSVGNMDGLSNTCLHRHWALEKIADEIDVVNTSGFTSLWYRIAYHLFLYGLPVRIPENQKENEQIVKKVSSTHYDIIWIDKGVTIYPETLKYIKEKSPQTIIISYSPDNMALRHNQSQQYLECIPLYDFIITNKSYILNDMRKLGAKDIRFINNSYESSFHYPRILTNEDYKQLGGDIGFVGAWEKERCESILYLAKHGLNVRVWGGGKWLKYKGMYPNLVIENKGLYSEDYSKSFQAFKISLCFLRKINYDQQTTRTVEIPACGGFMIAERTAEHKAMFEEGKEAEFFSSNEELLEKCQYYLIHEKERKQIADAGLKRCQISGYSNENTIRNVIESILNEKS